MYDSTWLILTCFSHSDITSLRFPLFPWHGVREALNQRGRDMISKSDSIIILIVICNEIGLSYLNWCVMYVSRGTRMGNTSPSFWWAGCLYFCTTTFCLPNGKLKYSPSCQLKVFPSPLHFIYLFVLSNSHTRNIKPLQNRNYSYVAHYQRKKKDRQNVQQNQTCVTVKTASLTHKILKMASSLIARSNYPSLATTTLSSRLFHRVRICAAASLSSITFLLSFITASGKLWVFHWLVIPTFIP
jgi:hypothetical protein